MPCSDLRVVGIKPPDDKWKKMKEAWDACNSACVPVPEEVLAFFDHEGPDEAGVVVGLTRKYADACWGSARKDESDPMVVDYEGDMTDGVEIHVDRLPKDVKIVRVTISY